MTGLHVGSSVVLAKLFGSTVVSLCISTAVARPLSVADTIETTRLRNGPAELVQSTDGALRLRNTSGIVMSPDRLRYVAMLITGDLHRNGLSVELITGNLQSFESARLVR